MLPFFHSFGFTGTLWFPLVAGFGVVFHPNPMDAKAIGELAEQARSHDSHRHADVLPGLHPQVRAPAVRALRYGVVGAEKLREPIARAFRERFGIDLLEGYGCTEMAPVVSVNVPDVADGEADRQQGGLGGHPLPGVVVQVVDPEHAGR